MDGITPQLLALQLFTGLALGAVYIAIRRVVDLRPMDLLKHGAGALA